MAGVSRGAIKKALTGSLRAGQKASYGAVQKALGAARVNPKYGGTVKAYQARAAFRKLKEAGVLSGRAVAAGAGAFMRSVKKADAPAGPSREQIEARGKVALRERLALEEAKKKSITEALEKKGGTEATERSSSARSPALGGVSAPTSRPSGPADRSIGLPPAERSAERAPSAAESEEEDEGPPAPSVGQAKDLPLD